MTYLTEREVNAMSEYLTWGCPQCGESKVRYIRIERTTGWLDPDGYEKEEEKLGDDEYKFRCDGCDAEIQNPDGSTFDEPMDIAKVFKVSKDNE